MLFNNRKFEKKQKCIAGPDEDYGAVDIGIDVIDMSPEEYDAKKIAFLKKIDLSVDEIIKIERNTVGQQEIITIGKNLENNDLRHLILEKFVN